MVVSGRESVPAIITAGGRVGGALAEAAGTTIKALVPVGGVTLLQRVLDGLTLSGRVGPTVIVGPAAELAAYECDGVRIVPEGESGPENIARALVTLPFEGRDNWVILSTCDLPFLDGDSIVRLIDEAPEDADILFPILTRQEYDAALPGSPNTYARLGREEYTGSSLFLVRPSAVERNRQLIDRVFAARKSQMDMARLLGVPFVLRFLSGRLTVAHAEARACALTGCRCRVLPHAPVSLAADLDTYDDYLFVQAALGATVPAAPQSLDAPIAAAREPAP